MQRRGHFTLMELLVVITVIAVLSGLTIAGVRYAFQRSEEAAIKSRMQKMEMALEEYKRDWGYYPLQATAGDLNFSPFISPDGKDYLEESTEPFRQSKSGVPMKYQYPGANNTEKYDLGAPGVDEVWDGGDGDDITNWSKD